MKTLQLLFLSLVPFLSNAQLNYHLGFSLGYLGTDGGNSMAIDAANNVYVAGTYQTYIDMDPGSGTVALNDTGSSGGFLAKYTPAGALVWAKNISTSVLTVDAAGNIYASGFYNAPIDLGGGPLSVAGDYDFFVAKFDSDGNHVWSRGFGGAGTDQVTSIKVSNNGSVIVVGGSFEETVVMDGFTLVSNANTGYSNSLVASFDGSGDVQWAYGFGRTGFGFDRVGEVALDNSGSAFFIGTFSSTNIDFDPGAGIHLLSSNGSSDIYVTRFDATGSFAGAFSIGGSTGELAGGIDIAANGDIYITGYSNSDSIDVDQQAGEAWLYGDSSILFVQDIIVVKYDFNADYQWGFRIGKRDSDTGWEINADAEGNVFVSCTMGDVNVDFDPGVGVHYLSGDTTFTKVTSVLAQYNSDGDFVDAFSLYDARNNDMALSGDGKVWIVGNLNGSTLDLNPGAGDATVTNAGLTDAFIAAYSYLEQVGVEEQQSRAINVYPVPAKDFVKISTHKNFNAQVEIYDVAGKLVKQVWMESDGRISLEGLNEGTYFLNMKTATGNSVSVKVMVVK